VALGKDLAMNAIPIKNTWNRYRGIQNTTKARTEAISLISPVYDGIDLHVLGTKALSAKVRRRSHID
jgi:hypothetical protein